MRKRHGIGRLVATAATSVVLAGGAYAFTASNTVSTSSAGAGSNTISGYDVTAVHYTLNATTPTNIDSVSFTLDTAPPTGATIKAKLSAAGTTYYSCTNTGTSVTCATTSPQATVSAADQLSVIAAQ